MQSQYQEDDDQNSVKGNWKVSDLKLCGPIPPHSPYGISFHLPNWEQIHQFIDEAPDVKSKLIYGYPRVFIHDFIKKSELNLLSFPSQRIARDAVEFLKKHAETEEQMIDLGSVCIKRHTFPHSIHNQSSPALYAVLYPSSLEPLMISFWQFAGETISARFAAHCLRLMGHEDLVMASFTDQKYLNGLTTNIKDLEYSVNFELGDANTKQAQQNESEIKLEIRKRIAKELSHGNLVKKIIYCNVYLFPTGMSAIYNSLRLSLAVSGSNKSVCFGFSYKHTPKVFEYFGPGSYFFGNGEEDDLDKLEVILQQERITMLLCEFPTNPLLKSPNLLKLRQLADKYKFILVLDNTIGNIINMQDQGIADIVVISLSKVFSGYSDVMGGSLIISPRSAHYEVLKNAMNLMYEDNLWCEEAYVLERNSRDLVERVTKANLNSEALVDLLKSHPLVKQVNYPKFTSTELYEEFKRRDGGYGSLLSFELHDPHLTELLYDSLPLAKGFSIGTNFTMIFPYPITAHHEELESVAQYGVRDHLLRLSVGLENTSWLCRLFRETLAKINGDPVTGPR